MSFILFESAREKERIRQELREAREQLLEKAKQSAEQRAQREAQRELRGEQNWMLPAVAEKIDKLSKTSKLPKKSKKKKDKTKKAKKSKKSKKSSKKRTHDSVSSESSDTDSDEKSHKLSKKKKKRRTRKESDSDSSSTEDTDSGGKHKSKGNHKTFDEYSSGTDSNGEEWMERPSAATTGATATVQEPLQRDSWMTETLMLKTFTRKRPEKQPAEKHQIDKYDPAKSTRELNPYWRTTGTGLPAFQKPSDDEDVRQGSRQLNMSSRPAGSSGPRSWQKKPPECTAAREPKHRDQRITSSSSSEEGPAEPEVSSNTKSDAATSCFLTDQQMNELGAKILKAEIMGNSQLASDLKSRLEDARASRAEISKRKQQGERSAPAKKEQQDEHILLTHTDQRGNARPLLQVARGADARDPYGGHKRQQRRAETHSGGERVRYFPDDDKYDIKQMFEREKYTSAAESNLQFANIASRHKNPNDDLDDIFADKIRQNVSEAESDRKEVQRAMHEQQKLSAQLDSCTRCFESPRMEKSLLVSMGEQAYLALPWHIGLQQGHCVIVPRQHVSCCTQLDEDTWAEISDFRKALTRMFSAQHKDVIFFEIANKLHRRPHLNVHCVPISEAQAEMAPFYFKKAIEESEHEWSVNKQLVRLRDKNLRASIPKGLPYFWVHFGMESGFAHVIEDENRFPPNFAQEIIGGMLQLDPKLWRRPQKEQNSIAKVKMFADWWKKFDCTN